jgi:hypothetical protein
MKKVFVLFVLSLFVLSANAQYRDVKLPEKPQMSDYKDYYNVSKGFWCGAELEAGSSVMVDEPNLQYASLSFLGGYRFSEFLRIGLGLGVRMYLNNAGVRFSNSRFGIPLYVNARGNFISAYDRGAVPFWSLSVGGITNDGFFFSPTLGYSFGGLRNNIMVGLNYTLATFTNYKRDNVVYGYLGIKVGYEF